MIKIKSKIPLQHFLLIIQIVLLNISIPRLSSWILGSIKMKLLTVMFVAAMLMTMSPDRCLLFADVQTWSIMWKKFSWLLFAFLITFVDLLKIQWKECWSMDATFNDYSTGSITSSFPFLSFESGEVSCTCFVNSHGCWESLNTYTQYYFSFYS